MDTAITLGAGISLLPIELSFDCDLSWGGEYGRTAMRKLPFLVSAATIAIAVAGLASPTSAQPYGMMGGGMMGNYGPGMMGGSGPGGMMGGYGCGGYGPGYGMMGGYGPGMMGGYGPGMMGGYGPGMMGGYGHGMMGGYGPGPMMGGYGPGYYGGQANLNLTTDYVKNYLERMIAIRGNTHLKVGDVKEKDADMIVADIVTKDNSLVQRFVVDRHTGFYRPDENQ